MSESPDFGADFNAGFDPVDDSAAQGNAYAGWDNPDPVDAEFVDVLADGTVLSTSTEIEVAPVNVTVTDIDGEPVEDPDKAGFPTLPGIGERPGGGITTPGAEHGQPRYPNAGGGSVRKGLGSWWRRKRAPKAAGASFGGGSGGGASKHYSLIGGIHPAVNVANGASAVRTGDVSAIKANSSGRRTSAGKRR